MVKLLKQPALTTVRPSIGNPDDGRVRDGSDIVAPPVFAPIAPAAQADFARDKHRYEMVDVVRFFAAAGVVFVHAIESKTLDRWSYMARFAVSFYMFAALYFQARSFKRDPSKPLLGYVLSRLHRLYLPFVAWSCIYLAARNVKRLAMLDRSPVRLSPTLLFSGGDYHLWFLPFLLVTSILTACLLKATILRDQRWRWPLIGAFTCAGIGFCFFQVPASFSPDFKNNNLYGLWQAWYTIPSFFLGVAFALFMAMGAKNYRVPNWLAACGIVVTLCALSYQVYANHYVQFPRAMSGLGCVLIALAAWHGPILHQIARLGRYGYGIYLSHILAVEVMHAILHHTRVPSSAYVDVATFAVSFPIAIAIARTLSRTKKLAWLNG